LKFNVNIPYDEDDNFFAEMTVAGFDAFLEDIDDLPEDVAGVFRLSRTADFKTVSEFAKNIKDSFDENIPLYGSNASFRKMSLSQLRRYFTLREKFRKGRYECDFAPYLTLYLNEVINLTGFDSYEKAASEIASILCEKGRAANSIQTLTKNLFRDFYVVYNILGSFYKFAETFGVEKFFPDSIIPEKGDVRLAVFYHNALFRIPKSTGFFASHYSAETFLRTAFFSVMKNLEPVFELYGKPLKFLEEDYFGRYSPYVPFGGLTFTKTPTRMGQAFITPSEKYEVSETSIKANIVNFPKSAAIFFGFILSVIEANMRALCSYPYQLDLDPQSVYDKIYETYDKHRGFYLDLFESDEASHIVKETTIDLYRKSVRFITKDPAASGISATSNALRKKLSTEPFTTFAFIKRNGEERRREHFAEVFKDHSDKLWKLSAKFDEGEFSHHTFVSFSGSFADLSMKELANYISIRTRVRNGDYENTNAFFWKIYLSELINTYNLTEEKVFKNLADCLKNTGYVFIGETLIQYYVLHFRDKGSFYDYASKYGVADIFSEIFSKGDFSFDEMCEISDYGIKKSKFYTEKTAAILEEVIPKLFKTLDIHFGEKGIDLKKLMYEESDILVEFYGGLVYVPARLPANTDIIISERLRYAFEFGNHFRELKTEYERKIMPLVIGLIMKNAEIALREIYGAKGKISVSDKISEKLHKKLSSKFSPQIARTKAGKAAILNYKRLFVAIFDEEFPGLIAKTVRELTAKISPEALQKYSPKPAPIKVEINFEKLGEIREESKEVAVKLGAVYEENETKTKSKSQSKSQITATPEKPNGNEKIKAFLTLLLIGEKKSAEKFALDNGTMFEVLAEKINEIFQEKIGDIVIENGEIIPDYTKEIKDYLGEF
jgi:hypothetical protein